MGDGQLIVYLNGNYLAKSRAAISPDDRGFLFADGAYEVIRYYRGIPFELDSHLRRMERSLGELAITGVNINGLGDIALQLIEKNDFSREDTLVYIQITRGAAPRRHAFPAPDIPPTVYADAAVIDPPYEKQEKGIRIILVPDNRWSRCDIKSVALLPNILAKQQAKSRGAGEAVFVRDGVVLEGAVSNFAAVFDGKLVTHPECNYLLSGVTRKVVLNLCKELGIPAEERPLAENELASADEMMVLSTTKEITPVVGYNDTVVADGAPGPVTLGLQKAFRELVSDR